MAFVFTVGLPLGGLGNLLQRRAHGLGSLGAVVLLRPRLPDPFVKLKRLGRPAVLDKPVVLVGVVALLLKCPLVLLPLGGGVGQYLALVLLAAALLRK